jgi:hypothetical protein
VPGRYGNLEVEVAVTTLEVAVTALEGAPTVPGREMVQEVG